MNKSTPPNNVVHIEIPANTSCEKFLDYPDLNLRGHPANTFDNLAYLVESMGLTLAQNRMSRNLYCFKGQRDEDNTHRIFKSIDAAMARIQKVGFKQATITI